jgi:hypothetical protein
MYDPNAHLSIGFVNKTIKTLHESEYYAIFNEKDGKVYRIHLATRSHEWVSQRHIASILGTLGGRNANWNVIPAKMDYRPDIFKVRFFDEASQVVTINKYAPPKYREGDFWTTELETSQFSHEKTNKTLDDLVNMPECYVDYFSHLCNGDKESIQYMLDWLAVAVDPSDRNITSLVLISPEGIGKGVLYDYLLTPLFGQKNVIQVKGKDALESRFNGQFLHKQIIFFDEVEVKTTAAVNRFKVLANGRIEIEQKGSDPFEVKNWANTILTSNDLDSINVTAGNRRFSIIHTSDVRLDKMCEESRYKTVTNLLTEIGNEDNIKSLYTWLITHKPDRNMNYAFASDKKANEIKEASLAEWELQTLQFLTDRYYKVNSKGSNGIAYVTMEHAQINLKEQGSRHIPGRRIMGRLAKKFPFLMKFKWDNDNRKHFFEVVAPYNPKMEDEYGKYVEQPGSF